MESHGALVGWGHHDTGSNLMVRLESMPTLDAADRHNPDVIRILMSKQQAAVLGTYLIKHSGQTVTDPRDQSWFRRLFG